MNRLELWKLSKFVLDESYFQTQLTAAGGQKTRFLERFEKNIGSMKRVNFLNMVIVSFFLLSIAIIPLFGLLEFSRQTISENNVHQLLFANSINLASYYLMSFVVVLVFGLLQLVELLRGNVFEVLLPMPFSKQDLQRLGIFVFIRMHYLQLIVLIFALPLGAFILLSNVILSIALILGNALSIGFYFYFIILIADFMGKKVFNEAKTSKISTIIRVLTILFYMIVVFNIYSVFDTLSTLAEQLYNLEQFSGSSGEIINLFLSLIPFPLSGGYLVTLTIIPISLMPVSTVFTTLLGFTVLIGISLIVMRRGNKILQNLGTIDEEFEAKDEIADRPIQVKIETNPPVIALMKNSLIMASRNYAGLFSLLAPLVFTILSVVVGISRFEGIEGNDLRFDPFIFVLFYIGFLPLLLRNGLFVSEENLGGILSSLPLKQRDLFRSKQFLMSLITNSTVLLVFLYQFITQADLYLVSGISVIFLNIIVSTVFLLLYAFLFGKVHKKYSLYMINNERSVLKNVLLFVVPNIAIILSLMYTNFVSILLKVHSPFGSILGFLSLILALEVISRMMFK